MKTISLVRDGLSALVDDADFQSLASFKWYPKVSGSGNVIYAVRWIRTESGRHYVKMEHDICPPSVGMLIDHKNGNGLDNQRSNLREATRKGNQGNRAPAKGRRFKGAFPTSCGFFARCAGKYLGHFKTEYAAALAYNKAAVETFRDFARLNTFTAEEIKALEEIR